MPRSATSVLSASLSSTRNALTSSLAPSTTLVPSLAAVAAPSSSSAPIGWSTSEQVPSQTMLTYFLEPYLLAHRLSGPSERAAYLLWFSIAAIFWIWSLEAILTKHKAGAFGALRDKLGMRRFAFTLGKAKKPKPGNKAAAKRLWTTATVAQMVSMVLMLAGITVACFLGNDYLNPSTCLFGGWCPGQAASHAPTQATYATNTKRWLPADNVGAAPQTTSHSFAFEYSSHNKHKRLARHFRALVARADPNPNGYAPMNDPLLSSANYAIHRNLWTSSARIGMIAFALCPLVVSLALKMWPFATFAVPWLMAYEFDKTVIYHRWIGIIIWILSTAHTATWTIQLIRDKDPYGKPVLFGMIYYWHFYGACAGYVALTLMVLLSFSAFRSRYYEFFYFSHMGLAIVFLVGCLLHFPPLKFYLIIALGLWGGERASRLIWWFWLNGFFHGLNSSEKQSLQLTKLHNKMNMTRQRSLSEKFSPSTSPVISSLEKLKAPPSFTPKRGQKPPPIMLYQVDQPQHYAQQFRVVSNQSSGYPPVSPTYTSFSYASDIPVAASDRERPTPPPGFALAQLLPGKNIRLTIRVPSVVHWRTGQYTSLTIPSVNKMQGHPFTIANTDERQIRKVNQVGSEIVMLVGVRNGFTKRLWDEIVARRKVFGPAAAASSGGILIRAQVGQPTGTAGRARLDDFESVLIICGGTGISFGMAVMEHVCLSMSVRDTDRQAEAKKKPCKTQRVRFVWILREFAHLSWVAPAVRRCLDMCPPGKVRIDLFVTRDTKAAIIPSDRLQIGSRWSFSPLDPPSRPSHRRQGSADTTLSDEGDTSLRVVPLVQPVATATLDYVLFDGEDEEQTAAELQWSHKVQEEGKLRRARSRHNFTGKRQRPQRFGGSNNNTPSSSPVRRRFSQGDLKPPKQDVIRPPLPRSTSDDLLDAYYATDPQSGTSLETLPISLHDTPYSTQNGYFASTQETLASFKTHHSDVSCMSSKQLLDQSPSRPTPFRDEKEDLYLDVSEAEMDDLKIISELARTGHPDIPKIMDEEQEHAQGRLMVACCGPIKLNVTVRALVAERIHPIQVAKGDLRGAVALMVEDFE